MSDISVARTPVFVPPPTHFTGAGQQAHTVGANLLRCLFPPAPGPTLSLGWRCTPSRSSSASLIFKFINFDRQRRLKCKKWLPPRKSALCSLDESGTPSDSAVWHDCYSGRALLALSLWLGHWQASGMLGFQVMENCSFSVNLGISRRSFSDLIIYLWGYQWWIGRPSGYVVC